jgi:hypothetical protein
VGTLVSATFSGTCTVTEAGVLGAASTDGEDGTTCSVTFWARFSSATSQLKLAGGVCVLTASVAAGVDAGVAGVVGAAVACVVDAAVGTGVDGLD